MHRVEQRAQERSLVRTAREEHRKQSACAYTEGPADARNVTDIFDVYDDRSYGETEASEKQRKCDLLQERKRLSDLEDAPAREFGITDVAYAEVGERRQVLVRKVKPKPLLDYEAE